MISEKKPDERSQNAVRGEKFGNAKGILSARSTERRPPAPQQFGRRDCRRSKRRLLKGNLRRKKELGAQRPDQNSLAPRARRREHGKTLGEGRAESRGRSGGGAEPQEHACRDTGPSRSPCSEKGQRRRGAGESVGKTSRAWEEGRTSVPGEAQQRGVPGSGENEGCAAARRRCACRRRRRQTGSRAEKECDAQRERAAGFRQHIARQKQHPQTRKGLMSEKRFIRRQDGRPPDRKNASAKSGNVPGGQAICGALLIVNGNVRWKTPLTTEFPHARRRRITAGRAATKGTTGTLFVTKSCEKGNASRQEDDTRMTTRQ